MHVSHSFLDQQFVLQYSSVLLAGLARSGLGRRLHAALGLLLAGGGGGELVRTANKGTVFAELR